MSTFTVQKANEFIKENKQQVNQIYKPAYHATAEIGWINDPNGVSFYKDEYHLFFQYYPYKTFQGPMHWGHVVSKDLVQWKHLPVAIAPNDFYDESGCFSGSAIEDNGKHILMYTGHLDPNPQDPSQVRQTQCIAIGDGVNYTKLAENPVLTSEHLPVGASIQDFRDPKLWKDGDEYFAVIGSRAQDNNGQILVYKSLDLKDWMYVGVLLKSDGTLGDMWECPDLFSLDGQDVLLFSPQNVKREEDRYHNLHSVVYIIGAFNKENGEFSQSHVDELDYGFDFYAPQTLIDNKGRRIMIGWMQMWERSIPTAQLGHQWCGMMTLPRVLSIEGDVLLQQPVEEIENYRTNPISYHNNFSGELTINGVEGTQVELIATFKPMGANRFGVKVRKGELEETVLTYDIQTERLTLDRSKGGHPIVAASAEKGINDKRTVPVMLENGSLTLRLFLDHSSVEAFINHGQRTMSSTVYPSPESKGIEFFSDGELELIVEKWDLALEK
jgi:beta-fructofuranosidase